MYLGKWRNKNPRFKNIKWSTKPVKALGVFHGYAIDLEMIWVSSANMFTFVSISGPFLFGKDMPTILGLRLMDVANGSHLKHLKYMKKLLGQK
jgi:hypothetical protein